MSSGGPSNTFLILGVVINVVLTGLAIWWLVRQGVKKDPPKNPTQDAPPEDQR